jgi:hypothetical protein
LEPLLFSRIRDDCPGKRYSGMDKSLDDISVEELKAELKRIKDNLCDLEDMHSFTFVKTSVHIGAEKAQNMQSEFDEECGKYNKEIAEIDKALNERGKL